MEPRRPLYQEILSIWSILFLSKWSILSDISPSLSLPSPGTNYPGPRVPLSRLFGGKLAPPLGLGGDGITGLDCGRLGIGADGFGMPGVGDRFWGLVRLLGAPVLGICLSVFLGLVCFLVGISAPVVQQ